MKSNYIKKHFRSHFEQKMRKEGVLTLFNDIFERYVINTNDPNRNIESIPCFEAIKDIKSYKCFYCEE